MSENQESKGPIIGVELAILIALLNLAFFGGMFTLMHYFELMGADPAYFDQGTINNLKMINTLMGNLGLEIDPNSQKKISTLGYSLCLGLALISSFFAIVISNRQSLEAYEVTEAKKK